MTEDNRITICGATGYIGTHLVSKLRQRGFSVNCLIRPRTEQTAVTQSGAIAGMHSSETAVTQSGAIAILKESDAQIVYADLSGSKPFKPSVIDALSGTNVLVNLVGSIAPKRGETLDGLHIQHTAKLVNLCNACGIEKLVMVTALGTHENASSKYHASKWKAEQALINSGLNYVILRPSLVYGRRIGDRDSKLVRRFIDLINDRPIVPLIAGGHNRLQPIFIDDLLQCIEASLTPGQHDNCVLELGGTEVMELRQFVGLLMGELGQNKPLVDMPVAVARSIAAVCELTQEVPILSRDQITLALSDNVCEHNALEEVFHVAPTLIAEGLRSYASNKAAMAVGV